MELPQLPKIPAPDPLHRLDTGRVTEVRSRSPFNADAGEPAAPPMVFQVVHNKLQASHLESRSVGNAHPPAMEKGYKVKYLFWTTTMP